MSLVHVDRNVMSRLVDSTSSCTSFCLFACMVCRDVLVVLVKHRVVHWPERRWVCPLEFFPCHDGTAPVVLERRGFIDLC